ncbi:MAG: winged helix-turn-helix transcriptional regulator, partial [Nitrospiria bacterium]
VPGVNPRMLALRLKELEEIGLIRREVFSTTPVKIDYSLSDLGKDVIPVMYAMAEFSMKNFPEEVFEDGESRSTEKVYREVVSR